jgi:fructose-bisphosphate aldolase class II/tagatose 1,6-diphosphate aldolase GatY/KbaY
MRLQDKLLHLKAERKAILAANFYNFETLSGILQAASLLKMPVVLQLSESSIRYMGLTVASAIAKSALREYAVEGWLHLDHGSSVEIVQSCLDEGFDSVMIDASEKSLDENIRITRQVVKIAAGYDANVEAELGFVAKLGQKQNDLPNPPMQPGLLKVPVSMLWQLLLVHLTAFTNKPQNSILNCLPG